mgnify:CR=1 FL=1
MIIEYETTNKAETMLVNALKRLVSGEAIRVKPVGRLTLNRINKEAGLGNSYIHKFKGFVEYVKPVIEKYNLKQEQAISTGSGIEIAPPSSELDSLKAKLKRTEELKHKYRIERDNAVAAKKLLEQQNSELRFRIYDIQEELLQHKQVVTTIKGKRS